MPRRRNPSPSPAAPSQDGAATRADAPAGAIMTGMALREARLALGLTTTEMAGVLGYEGERLNLQKRVTDMETGAKPLPRLVALLAECLMQGARPHTWPQRRDRDHRRRQ